ncbi:MAG: hypothetical protein FWG14_13505 [Peptococcaceae bacterium]|nr:hypothetical protein [Peptococcaceae bacterium]
MGKVFVKTVTYVVDLSEHMEGQDDKDLLDQKVRFQEALHWDQKSSFLEGNREQDNLVYEHICTCPEIYDTDVHNIGKCATCGTWTTDIEEEEAVFEMVPGMKVDGVLYCDPCLSEDEK